MAEPLPVAILVEDERQIRRFVRTALETEGWSVYETETMRQGLIDAGTRKPDLIILDLGLPDGDGMEFLRDLRGWSSVSVIVVAEMSSSPARRPTTCGSWVSGRSAGRTETVNVGTFSTRGTFARS